MAACPCPNHAFNTTFLHWNIIIERDQKHMQDCYLATAVYILSEMQPPRYNYCGQNALQNALFQLTGLTRVYNSVNDCLTFHYTFIQAPSRHHVLERIVPNKRILKGRNMHRSTPWEEDPDTGKVHRYYNNTLRQEYYRSMNVQLPIIYIPVLIHYCILAMGCSYTYYI